VTAPRWAAGVCDGLHRAGVRDVVYVPDNPLSHVLRDFGDRFADVRLVLATREEEAFGIAAGLYLGGRRAAVLLQSSGVGNSLNALTSLLIPYEIPVPMVVSMRGDAGEWNAAQEPMGRGIRGIFDAIGIPHVTLVGGDGAAGTIERAVAHSFESLKTCACLLPRLVTTKPD
jgi:sulfopyruvate decarboxylase subunit alpha